ncbi:MAG: WXG100 family type VII secretion target [Lachnospiraceae bacterium]|nr:WXG100 family type VII secretion target [Lachnospiraceae bacterium]
MTIEVNHQTLRDVAKEIEGYCELQDSEMQRADGAVKSMLTNGWIGPDAREFGGKWEGVDAQDSTAIKFKDSLMGFGDALTTAADEYQRAQEDSYNQASWLPRNDW